MSNAIETPPVIIRDFTIRPLALASQHLMNKSSLKLQITTEDEKVQKPMVMSTESENILWTANGGVQVSSTTRQLRIAISIEDDGVATELCNATLSRVHLARHAREYSNDLYAFMMKNATSSTLLLVTCMTRIPPSHTTSSSQDSTAVSNMTFGGSNSSSSIWNTATLNQSIPSPPGSTPSGQMSPECLELERQYENTSNMPREARTRALNAIGLGYLGLVQKSHDTAIMDRAISILDEAVQYSSIFDRCKAKYLTDFSTALITRFKRTGDLAALSGSIEASQNAVLITDEGDPYKTQTLDIYAAVVESRYEQFGDLEDLHLAITQYEKAIELASDPTKSVLALNNLAGALLNRFNRLGDVQDLEAAISHLQKAVELTPDDHPDKPSRLSNLGGALETRFDRLGRIEDIDAAIRHNQMAVELTSDDHPDKPSMFSNLGSAFQTRFNRLGCIEDLQTAIRHKQRAVELAPENHPVKPAALSNLGNSLDTRFDRLKRVDDIEASLSHGRMAVKLTPEGHSDGPSRLSSLANTLVLRFRHLDDVKDVEEAITNYRMALELLPKGHPDKSTTLINLASAFYSRYEKLGQQGDLQSAYECSSSVANLASVPPAMRLQEARRWANFSVELGLSPLPGYQVVIDMLPRVAWLGLPIHDQHALLEDLGEVVRDAIAVAIEEEDYELAVEWVEAGRSIAWQNFLNLRSPLDELRLAYPDLAVRLQSISQQIDMIGRSSDLADEPNEEYLKSMDLVAKSTIQLAVDWDKTVEDIRVKPGFESFLKTKTFDQLAPAATQGPIIILNVHYSQSDALILRRKEDGSIHCTNTTLTHFTHAISLELFSKMKGVLEVANVRSRDSRKLAARSDPAVKTPFEEILSSLWTRVAKVVVQELGQQPRPSELPHIWWCVNGPLALLPIHAAGLYDKKHRAPGHKISDYVVSSYTPMLSSLLETSYSASEEVKILAVAQANAPGASSIPETEIEVDMIESLVGNVPLTSLRGEGATIEKVLEGMEKNSWVHLACHGQQNLEEPMKSGLLLHNGKLELERLIEKSLPSADFAFLSACQTATGDEKVPEESVHLAAGMIFSGYKGVIATMWSIGDNDAPQIAEDVYRYMLGDGKPDRKKAAHALHYAVKRLRDSKGDANFLSWVPFIHIGR